MLMLRLMAQLVQQILIVHTCRVTAHSCELLRGISTKILQVKQVTVVKHVSIVLFSVHLRRIEFVLAAHKVVLGLHCT